MTGTVHSHSCTVEPRENCLDRNDVLRLELDSSCPLAFRRLHQSPFTSFTSPGSEREVNEDEVAVWIASIIVIAISSLPAASNVWIATVAMS